MQRSLNEVYQGTYVAGVSLRVTRDVPMGPQRVCVRVVEPKDLFVCLPLTIDQGLRCTRQES